MKVQIMTINKKDLEEIAKKLDVGNELYLVDRLNNKDKETVTINDVKFDKELINPKNWTELIRAIFSSNNEFKNGDYAIAENPKKKQQYTVINTKKPNNPSFEVKAYTKNDTLIIENLKNSSKKTKIEIASMIKSAGETETAKAFHKTLVDRINKEKPSPKETLHIVNDIIKAAN